MHTNKYYNSYFSHRIVNSFYIKLKILAATPPRSVREKVDPPLARSKESLLLYIIGGFFY